MRAGTSARRPNWGAIFATIAVFAVTALTFGGDFLFKVADDAGAKALRLDSQFPSARDPDQQVHLAVGAGTPVVARFFSADCRTCRSSLLDLEALATDAEFDDVDFVAVAVGDPSAGLGSVAGLDPRLRIAADAGGTLAERFGVDSVPATILIDSDGRSLARERNIALPQLREELRARFSRRVKTAK